MPAAVEYKLLLVDGHAFAYRAFYAIRQLTSPAGQPTNAIYGFLKMLGKMQARLQPTHQAVIWDGGLAAERLAALPEYKSQRPPVPPSLADQIDGLQTYLQAARVPSLVQDGVEADDWIAALARQGEAAGFQVVIASADKDFLQLVGPRVGLLNPGDKSEKVWTAEDVQARTGVRPDQIVDWLSLVGDSVDNIPGVPGVGSKTAADLLCQFGSVNALWERVTEVASPKLRANLLAARPAVERNQQLIRLHDPSGVAGSLEALAVKPSSAAELRPLYAQWGFKTLLAQLEDTPLLW